MYDSCVCACVFVCVSCDISDSPPEERTPRVCATSQMCPTTYVFVHIWSVHVNTWFVLLYMCHPRKRGCHVCVRLHKCARLHLSLCIHDLFLYTYDSSVYTCVIPGRAESTFVCHSTNVPDDERWGAGVETPKNVRGEIGGWGRVPFNETYAPSLSTIYDGA